MYISATTLFTSLLAITASATVIPRASPPASAPSCSSKRDCPYGPSFVCDDRTQRCRGTGLSFNTCTVDWECFSNWCVDGTCKGNTAAGKPCTNTETDCSNVLRDRDYRGLGGYTFCPKNTGDKPRTCVAGDLGEGDQCTYDEQCAWKRCNNGVCEKAAGNYGSPCKTQSDCLSGTTCTYGILEDKKGCRTPQKGYYGSPCNTDSDCVTKNCGLFGEKFCGVGAPPSCKLGGLGCWTNADCCSKKCVAGDNLNMFQCAYQA